MGWGLSLFSAPRSPTMRLWARLRASIWSFVKRWRRLLRVPWTAGRSNQSILKEISLEYSLEGLMLKLQFFGHLMRRADSLEKTLMLGKIEGKKRRGWTEDEMVGWHQWLDGHEFEQAPGISDGQGSLTCCSPWGHKESDKTEQLNWTEAETSGCLKAVEPPSIWRGSFY